MAKKQMTIREQSELSLFDYTFKLIVPHNISVFVDSAKDAWPFIYNLLFLVLSPILLPTGAFLSRRNDRKFVKEQDLKYNRKSNHGTN